MTKTRVFIVEDERLVAKDIRRRLQEMGYDVPAIAGSGREAAQKVVEMRPDIVLMDIDLGEGIDGIEAASQIRSQVDIPIIFVTAYANEALLARAKLTTPFGYILKPFQDAELRNTIEIALYKQAQERKLQEFVTALEAKNAELEQFTYSVSHDLKSPLVTINGFLGMLEQDALAGDTERLRTDIGHISDAADRMQRLIDDLLQLSRIGRQKLPTETLAMGAFLRAVITAFHFPDDVEIDMADEWPTVEAQPALLRQIFQNLIGNAVKFNTASPKRVELGWSPIEGVGYEFFVRDNGIGIDPAQHEHVFGIFNRLHAKDAFQGTGIGLALVKKAAARLGGAARVESAIGAGSTFYLTLPSN